MIIYDDGRFFKSTELNWVYIHVKVNPCHITYRRICSPFHFQAPIFHFSLNSQRIIKAFPIITFINILISLGFLVNYERNSNILPKLWSHQQDLKRSESSRFGIVSSLFCWQTPKTFLLISKLLFWALAINRTGICRRYGPRSSIVSSLT